MPNTLSPIASSFLLSNIDIDGLAESYRKKSFGYTEKHQDRFRPDVQYTYKPIWTSWTQFNKNFLLKVSVRSYINGNFGSNEYLWFNVIETPLGIKARSIYNKNMRFGLCSLRFADSQCKKILSHHYLIFSAEFQNISILKFLTSNSPELFSNF